METLTAVEQLGDHIVEFLIDTEEVNALQAAAGLKFSGNLYPLAEEIYKFLRIDDMQGQIIELTATADPELLVKYEELQRTQQLAAQRIETLEDEVKTYENSLAELQNAYRKLLDQQPK